MAEAATTVPDNTAQTANATEEEKTCAPGEHQPANCEETFGDIVSDEYKLRCTWTLWEHYEAQGGEQMDYASSMCKAAWFNDLVSFSVAWNSIPHRDLNNIFYQDLTKKVKL